MTSSPLRSAWAIAGLYALGAGLWIILSDRAVEALAPVAWLTPMQTYKGWFFVATTALLLFFVLRRQLDVVFSAASEQQQAEKQLRLTFDQSPIGAVVVAPNFHFQRANAAFCLFIGYSEAELQKLTFADVTHPEYKDKDREEVGRLISGLIDRYETDKRYLHKNGHEVWGRASVGLIRTDDNEPLHLIATVQDITERIRAEHALIESEKQYRALFENAPLGIFQSSPAGRYIVSNPRHAAILGYESPDDLINSIQDIAKEMYIDPSEREAVKKQLLDQGHINNYETQRKRKDGSIIWVSLSSRSIQDESGQILFHGFITDITNRKSAELEREAALTAQRQSELRFRTVFENAPLGLMLTDALGMVTDCNEHLAAIFEVSRIKYLGMNLLERLPEGPVRQNLANSITLGGVHQYEGPYTSILSGKKLDIHLSTEKIAPDLFITIVEDITERKRTEKALQQRIVALTQPLDNPAGIQFSDLFDINQIQAIQDAFAKASGVASIITLPDGTPITRPTNFCRLCNDVIRKTEKGLVNCFKSDAALGRQNPDGPTIQPCLSGGLWDAGASISVGGKHLANWLIGQVRNDAQNETQMLRYADEIGADLEDFASALKEVPVMSRQQFNNIAQALFTFANELSTKAYQNIQQARFITERDKAEEERLTMERSLFHAQKLESLGILAGGIAHDFNNLLAAILGNLELARPLISSTSPAKGNIEQAEIAAKRAADLTRQMLAYSGKGHFIISNIDLSHLVRENAHLFTAVLPKKAELKLNLTEHLPRIAADVGQIQQVVMNVITNAAEALGDSLGTVTLSTGIMDCDEACLEKNRTEEKIPPGRFVTLEVTDTGCGMDEDTLARLFDPFFTTKFTGRGLGMAALLGIVRGHRGAIFVDSQVGRGSSIRVLFPITKEMVSSELKEIEPITAAPSPIFSGTILVVDDEKMIRDFCTAVLQTMGFEVLTAADGEEAVDLLQAHAQEIACVLLDLTMPRMDGLAAFTQMQRIKPDVRIVLSSGYSEQEAMHHFTNQKPSGFIQKPFQLKDLKAELARVLAETI